MDTWLEKYRPKTLEDYLDYDKYYKDILDPWINAYNKRRLPKYSYIMYKPFIVLVGEPGVGKTTLAHCLFNSHDYHINECNASATRTKTSLDTRIRTGKRVVGHGMRLENVGVIMDEIDGLSINESNGVNALLDIVLLPMPSDTTVQNAHINRDYSPADSDDTTMDVKSSNKYHPRYPMILTANSIKERKFTKLIDMSIIINVKSPSYDALVTLANKINKAENIGLTQSQISEIIISLGKVTDYRIIIQQLWRIYHAKMASSDILCDNISNNALDKKGEDISDNDEIAKISLDNKMTRQLLHVATMDIRDAVSSIILHCPYHISSISSISSAYSISSGGNLDDVIYKKFRDEYYQQLQHIIECDPNLYYLSIWENYASVLAQIYTNISKTKIKTRKQKSGKNSCKNKLAYNTQNKCDKESYNEYLYKKIWIAWHYIGLCYQQCSVFENQISITQNWDMQPYNTILGPMTGIRLLNELNYSSNKDGWLSNTVKISYHTQYNNMKQDSGHISNLLRFRTISIPGNHNISSKDLIYSKSSKSKHKNVATTTTNTSNNTDPCASYCPVLDTLCFDPELFYLTYTLNDESHNINNSSSIAKYNRICKTYGNFGDSVIKKINKVYKKLHIS